MKAITVRQPWAELIASGTKLVENRSRRWGHVGEIAIHAGQVKDYGASGDPLVRAALPGRSRLYLPLGFIVAVATLTSCHRADGSCCAPWGQHGDGVHHLVLADVLRLTKPVPARGALGLWTVPDDVADQVAAALP